MLRQIKILMLFPLFLGGIAINAQEEFRGIPDDLNESKIVFLEYDQLDIPDALPKGFKRSYGKRNEAAVISNGVLKKEAKNYPFEYVIGSRKDLGDLRDQGYKYILESPLMKGYNSGSNMRAGFNQSYISHMYIIDLNTGDSYKLFLLEEMDVYDYKEIMKKFVRKTKRAFKL